MLITHKIFLYWLLYIVIVVFCGTIAYYLGLPQLIVAKDHSYLSILIIALYAVTEMLAARQIIWLDSIHKQVMETSDWVSKTDCVSVESNGSNGVRLIGTGSEHDISKGPFADLVESANHHMNAGDSLDKKGPMEAFMEQLERRTNISAFLSSRIVWIGILATIVGVIMAFWPFQQAGMTVDTMRNNLGAFFSGVAVAFIPTAVSFVFKIFLDFNTKIADDGISEVIEVSNRVISSISARRSNGGNA